MSGLGSVPGEPEAWLVRSIEKRTREAEDRLPRLLRDLASDLVPVEVGGLLQAANLLEELLQMRRSLEAAPILSQLLKEALALRLPLREMFRPGPGFGGTSGFPPPEKPPSPSDTSPS